MARAEALAGVAVEVFVEKHEVAPMCVGGEARVVAVARTATVAIGEEEARETRGEFVGYLLEIHQAA
jgi:hypothetical protein